IRTLQTNDERLGGYDELVPYVLASPDQEDAGSCLYMSLTGVAEWWLARLNPELPRTPNGPLDLSERYLMNLNQIEEDDSALPNWRTDTIFSFNRNGQKSVQNVFYPFAKGWFTGTVSDNDLRPAAAGTPGASYGVDLNWYDGRAAISDGWVALPEFDREVIFADPSRNQWNIGVAPQDIVDRVKQALLTRKAPVQVIYNHNAYWHSVFVIGFNDELDNGACAYTERFRTRIAARVAELERARDEAQTPGERDYYTIRAQRADEARAKIEDAYARGGGCTSSRGVFYIRDSIYPDANGPIYDYDRENLGPEPDEAPYTRRIVTKEYDWLRYFANNVSVIFAK
ncbi:MAG: hypothetical protein NDJ90_12645, partial [Oligoflexia bacterium]|nr:hypothetical protein [Oligoflexia bacterium]